MKEADGSVEVFSVPYASVAQLLRPGMTRYALSAGKVDDSALRNKPMLYQATWQHGINNLLTGYTGVTGFDDYQAFLVGTGMNTGIGALSFDVTHSRLKSDAHDDSGQSYRAMSVVNLKNSDAVKRLIFETITKLNSDNAEEKNHFDFYFTEISAQQHLCIKSNSVKQHKQYNEKNGGAEPGQRHANSKKTLNRL